MKSSFFRLLGSAGFAILAGVAGPAWARTWTSSEGRTIEAEFIEATETGVTIRRADGRRFTLPLDRLSEDDQAFVREKLAELAAPQPLADGPFTIHVTGKWERIEDADLPFRLFGSPDLDGSQKYPLVIYLHGRGGDVMTPDRPGQADRFSSEENYKARPCFIIAPQCPKEQFWNGPNTRAVVELIDELVKNLPIDEDRIYLTGYSMGAYGTFTLLADEPKRFAAAIPVAGGGNPASARAFRKVPVWIFHGDADDVVDVEQSRSMHAALEDARAPVDYTEFPGEGHGIGGKVYNDPAVHEWLFAQKRGAKAAE